MKWVAQLVRNETSHDSSWLVFASFLSFIPPSLMPLHPTRIHRILAAHNSTQRQTPSTTRIAHRPRVSPIDHTYRPSTTRIAHRPHVPTIDNTWCTTTMRGDYRQYATSTDDMWQPTMMCRTPAPRRRSQRRSAKPNDRAHRLSVEPNDKTGQSQTSAPWF